MKKLPDIDILNHYLNYEPDTGLVRWKVRSAKRIKVGDIAGSISGKGQLVVSIEKQLYQLHRVIWKLQTGEDPIGWVVEHKDKDITNNIWNNLCLMRHPLTNKPNKTGFKGVVKHRRRFKAQLWFEGTYYHIGIFKTPEEAHQAYLQKIQELLLN